MAFDELGTDVPVHADIRIVARKRSLIIGASQFSEDLGDFAKNSKVCKGKRRYRSVAKVYLVQLAKGVIDKVHRYKTIEPSFAPEATSINIKSRLATQSQRTCQSA